jgi:ABC-type iron transport system FetAB permease component
MMLQLFMVGFVAVFIWAVRRSHRRVLTAVYSLASMVVTLFLLDRIARQLPDSFDHGRLAFIGTDVMFAVGAAAACFHSSHTRRAIAAGEAEVTNE